MLKRWWLRHLDRRRIRQAFKILKRLYPNLSVNSRWSVVCLVTEMMDEYHFNWGYEDCFLHDRWIQLTKMRKEN